MLKNFAYLDQYWYFMCSKGKFLCFCCRLLSFLFFFFEKNLLGTLSELQTFWTQIRTDKTSVLIWAKTVCKGYLQRTEVITSKKRVTQIMYTKSKIIQHITNLPKPPLVWGLPSSVAVWLRPGFETLHMCSIYTWSELMLNTGSKKYKTMIVYKSKETR